MAGRRRRGSSTRKYKVPLSSPKPTKETTVLVPPKLSTEEQQRQVISKMEAQIRSGVNIKGQPLTDKEIGVFLTTISSLEKILGIKHYQ